MLSRKWFLLTATLVAGIFAIVRAQEPRLGVGDDEPQPLSLETADESAVRSVLKRSPARPSDASIDVARRPERRSERLSTSISDGNRRNEEIVLEAPSVLKRKTRSTTQRSASDLNEQTASRTATSQGQKLTSRDREESEMESDPVAQDASLDEGSDSASSAGLIRITSSAPQISVRVNGPAAIVLGKAADYTVVVVNEGREAARDLHIRMSIPAGVDLMQSESNYGATRRQEEGGADRLIWAIDEVPARSRMELTLKLVARESQPIDFQLDWIFRALTASSPITVLQPQLELTVAGPKDVLFGETITYLITLANPGNGDAENVVVKLGTSNNAPETIDVGTINAGQQKEVEVQLVASQAGIMKLRAVAQAAGDLNAEIVEEVTVRRAALEVAMSGPKVKYAATESVYEVRLSNTGNAAAEDVAAMVLLPPGSKLVSASDGGKAAGTGVNWRLGSLGPGAERSLQLVCELTAAGDNRVEVRLQGAGGITTSDSVITQVQSLADLKLLVNEPKGPRPLGEVVTYEIQISNRGTKAAEKVNVVVQFSEGVEPVSADGFKSEILAGQVVFNPISKIDAGQQVTLKVRAKSEKDGSHLFRVEVKCAEPETRLVSEGTTRFFGEESDIPAATKLGRKVEPARKSR